MGRVLIGGIVGGLVFFIWGAVAHMALSLGDMGMNTQRTAGQNRVLTAMNESLPDSGLYLMPGFNPDITDSDEQMKELGDRWAKGPVAFLVLHKDGMPMMEAKHLISEGITNILCALIAAIVLMSTNLGYLGRAMLVMLMGVFAWLSISASFHIWYGFPKEYTLAQGIEQAVGWLIAGLVISAIVKPKLGPSG